MRPPSPESSTLSHGTYQLGLSTNTPAEAGRKATPREAPTGGKRTRTHTNPGSGGGCDATRMGNWQTNARPGFMKEKSGGVRGMGPGPAEHQRWAGRASGESRGKPKRRARATRAGETTGTRERTRRGEERTEGTATPGRSGARGGEGRTEGTATRAPGEGGAGGGWTAEGAEDEDDEEDEDERAGGRAGRRGERERLAAKRKISRGGI